MIGGFGEKKYGTQWRQQDRVYDTNTVSPALARKKADLAIIEDEKCD